MLWESQYNYLQHYGVKGQVHGKRRYQNEDGSLTPEGREHYGVGEGDGRKKSTSNENAAKEAKRQKRREILKTIGKGAAAAAAVAAVGYGAKKAFDKSTKLRDTVREIAEDEVRYHNYNKAFNAGKARIELRNAKVRRLRPETYSDRKEINDYGNKLHYDNSIKSAKSYFGQARYHNQMAKKYADIAKKTTRRKAVMNYIKNKGRLVVEAPNY